MSERTNLQWRLARRSTGMVTPDLFVLVEQPVPEVGPGEVIVRNLYLSCDPTQRTWLGRDTYLPALKVGDVIRSYAAAEVIESRHEQYAPGQLVQGMLGWQEFAVVKPSTAGLMPLVPGVPIEASLSVLGLNGLAAYFGLLEIGQPRAGETVVVSSAAGATGSAVAQIALIKGCRVVGVAGGLEKCSYLKELGVHEAIDYKEEDVSERLRDACETGIDVYFDNVGGEVLNAALGRLAMHGRVVICGAMSRHNDMRAEPGPSNYLSLGSRRGRMQGFIVFDYMDRAPHAIAELRQWMLEGRLRYRADVLEGLEKAPEGLARLYRGENRGKQLIKLANPSASGGG